MRSHGLSRESSPYLEWDCEGTGSKLQRVPRALRFGLQLVVDQMLQTLKSCNVCRAPYLCILLYFCPSAYRRRTSVKYRRSTIVLSLRNQSPAVSSLCLCLCLPVSVCLSASVCLSLLLSVCLPICPLVSLSLPFHLSVCRPASLSVFS